MLLRSSLSERLLASVVLLAAFAAFAACVDVPDGVRAQFAGPNPAERSNFRPGHHGQAPPASDPPAPKAAETAVTGAMLDGASDGGGTPITTTTATATATDGGAP